MATEKVIIEIEIDKSDAEKRLLAVQKQLAENRKEQDALKNAVKEANKAGKEADNATLLRLAELERQRKSLTDAQKRANKELETESNSINALRQRISQLNAERNNLNTSTEDGAKRFEELTNQLKDLNETVNEASKGAGQFKDNVGNYAESVKEGIQNTEFFGVKLKDVGNIFGIAKGAVVEFGNQMLILGRVLLTNPIFLIATALATVVGAFLKTEKGAQKLQQAFAPVGKILQDVFSVLAQIGEDVFPLIEAGLGLVRAQIQFVVAGFKLVYPIIKPIIDGVALIASGLKSITDGFGDSGEGAKQLVSQVQGIVKLQRVIDENAAKNKRRQEEARKERDDESRDIEDRIKANEKLGRVLIERRKTEVAGLKEILRIREAELKAIPQNLRSEEDINKVKEARVALDEKLEELTTEETEQLTNQVSLQKELADREVARIEARLRLDLATNKIREGSIEQLNLELKAIEKKFEAQIKATKGAQAIELLRLERDAEIAEKRKEFNDAQLESFTELQDKLKELRDKAFQDELARLELATSQADENSKEQLKAFADFQTRKAEIEIIQSEATAEQAKLIRFNAQKAIEDNAKKAFEAQKALQDEAEKERADFEQRQNEASKARQSANLQATQESLQKENELIKASLDEELNLTRLASEEKLRLLDSFSSKEIENLNEQANVRLELLQSQYENEIGQYELFSEEFLLQQENFERERAKIIAENEQAVSDVKREQFQKRQAINEAEKESEANKVNAIAGLSGVLSQALGEQTAAGQVAAFVQAQINALITASNVYKTLSAFAPPPVPQIGAVATFLAAQKYANEINSINTSVQQTATAFNPNLKFDKSLFFAGGGKVPSGFELAGLPKTGDNTLIMVKPNEVVLNEAQQSRLGGARAMALAGVPGFANGGIVGVQSSIKAVEAQTDIFRIAQAIEKMPAPILDLRQLTTAQKRVQVKENLSSL